MLSLRSLFARVNGAAVLTRAKGTSAPKMFDKIIVANRGEIACRVMRTAKRLGIRTVAVYSEADRHSMHVQEADEAVLIGQPPAAESYLRGERIIEAAHKTGAQAVHPGYGFLSENAKFAQLVSDSKLVFIGPPPSAITAMGSKSESKHIMTRAKVPVVPGYHGEQQSDAHLLAEADRIGYPVLIKPVMGGGGKGMKIVHKHSEFLEALQSSQREATASFGDPRVLIERYIMAPRHIEVQVFADTHGNAVYLFERDCSVQRRHQKVLEEAPAPGMGAEQRKAMGETAVAAARAVGYVGAGTVEFISDSADGTFYFMEMNTRLQVEHPVTEMVTGQDLVEWQLRVASGERLPLLQNELRLNGHAVEARVYAESPERGFLPSIGTLQHLRFPEGVGIRVDTGVRKGDDVKVFYDPMIAKLVTWGQDRSDALRRMRHALDQMQVSGVSTNVAFLRRAVAHPAFEAGGVTTNFIAQHTADLLPAVAAVPPPHMVALAAAAQVAAEHNAATAHAPTSPWARLSGTRIVPLGDDSQRVLHYKEAQASVHYGDGGALTITTGGHTLRAVVRREAGGRVTVEDTTTGRCITGSVVLSADTISVFVEGEPAVLLHQPASVLQRSGDTVSGSVSAPMPGRVTKVMAKPGPVTKGATLLVMEAMKMEYAIKAPSDGELQAVLYKEGDMVADGAALVKFVPAA